MEKIKVEIDPIREYPDGLPFNDMCFESWIVGKLRAAGIPVIGVLLFRGLKKGTLTRTNDYETNNMVYTWTNP